MAGSTVSMVEKKVDWMVAWMAVLLDDMLVGSRDKKKDLILVALMDKTKVEYLVDTMVAQLVS